MQGTLGELGYYVPTKIHSTAYIFPTASLGKETVVEPYAIINTNMVVEDGCIISLWQLLDMIPLSSRFAILMRDRLLKQE